MGFTLIHRMIKVKSYYILNQLAKKALTQSVSFFLIIKQVKLWKTFKKRGFNRNLSKNQNMNSIHWFSNSNSVLTRLYMKPHTDTCMCQKASSYNFTPVEYHIILT